MCVTTSFSVPQTTLAGHFQNATVDFLQPIEDPITISFATLLFAHNDSQNVSLVCPLLPFRSLSFSVSVSPSDPLCLESVSFSYPPTHISASVRNERGGKLQDCVYFSRFIEICLDANGRSCPPKCLSITRTHRHTTACKFACEFKQKAFAGQDGWCACVGVSIGSANAFAISRSVHMKETLVSHISTHG